jgi:hypothetical protein
VKYHSFLFLSLDRKNKEPHWTETRGVGVAHEGDFPLLMLCERWGTVTGMLRFLEFNFMSRVG